MQWIHKLDSGTPDEKGSPVQYWFMHTVGTYETSVHMATKQYDWEGDRSEEVSSIVIEPVMPIHMEEPFLFATYIECEEWKKMCTYWMSRN